MKKLIVTLPIVCFLFLYACAPKVTTTPVSKTFSPADSGLKAETTDTLINADYALLHVYRRGGAGALVSYDLHLGDTVICRVTNRYSNTIKIRKDGLNTLWAKTEAKKELPVNIKFGHEYYIRCSITMGAFVGHPKLEIVDNQIGRTEFQSIKIKNK